MYDDYDYLCCDAKPEDYRPLVLALKESVWVEGVL